MHILFIVLEFVIVLGILVLIHELGHFIVAKLCGVRVEVFSIGFGPRLFGVRIGDTDYRVALLPLGGYVKMAGDEPGHQPGKPARAQAIDILGVDIDPDALRAAADSFTATDAPRTAAGGFSPTDASSEFNARPRWQRVLIALAGPTANFLLAFFLLALVAHYHHEVDKYLNGPAVVDYVPVNTPAAADGIEPGDTIVRFDGVAHPTWIQILDECALNLNRSVPLSFSHGGHIVNTTLDVRVSDPSDFNIDSMTAIGLLPRMQQQPIAVASVLGGTPADRAGLQPGDGIARIDDVNIHSLETLIAYLQDRDGAPATLLVIRDGKPLTLRLTPVRRDNGIGARSYQIGISAHPVPTDIVQLPWGAALHQSYKDNRDDSKLVFRVIDGMFTHHVSVRSLSGPVGIAQQIGIATSMGIWTLLELVANISLQLGIFNLLPLPILDGGMILFLIVESIMRRDVNFEIKERVYQVAFVCFILFAVFVIFNDVAKLHLGMP